MVESPTVNRQQLVKQHVVTRLELARADVLGVVAPVTVGADPDLEQGRLVLLHRPIARGREGADLWARPHERETQCEVNVTPRRPFAVHVAEPERGRLALRHPGPKIRLYVLHRGRGDLV